MGEDCGTNKPGPNPLKLYSVISVVVFQLQLLLLCHFSYSFSYSYLFQFLFQLFFKVTVSVIFRAKKTDQGAKDEFVNVCSCHPVVAQAPNYHSIVGVSDTHSYCYTQSHKDSPMFRVQTPQRNTTKQTQTHKESFFSLWEFHNQNTTCNVATSKVCKSTKLGVRQPSSKL